MQPNRVAQPIFLLAVLALVSGGCDMSTGTEQEPMPAETKIATSCSSVPAAWRIHDVPAVEVDLPPEPRPWDTSDVALAAKLAEEQGHATIAFKEPESPHMLETGVREAVRAATIREGLEMLCDLDVELLDYFASIGAVHVRIDPELAPRVRSDLLVDYLEPRQWGRWRADEAAPVSQTHSLKRSFDELQWSRCSSCPSQPKADHVCHILSRPPFVPRRQAAGNSVLRPTQARLARELDQADHLPVLLRRALRRPGGLSVSKPPPSLPSWKCTIRPCPAWRVAASCCSLSRIRWSIPCCEKAYGTFCSAARHFAISNPYHQPLSSSSGAGSSRPV